MFETPPPPEAPRDDPPAFDWRMHSEPGESPFLVLREHMFGSTVDSPPYRLREIAIRSAVSEEQPRSLYYVAMRRTTDGIEEIDSRRCDFRDRVVALRDILPPVVFIPGADIRDEVAYPPSGGWGGPVYELVNYTARQRDGQLMTIEVSVTSGTVAAYISNVFYFTESCWPSAAAGSTNGPLPTEKP